MRASDARLVDGGRALREVTVSLVSRLPRASFDASAEAIAWLDTRP
jgi:hypothetical protein